MNKTDEFLAKYKELETILREQGLDYKMEFESEGKQNAAEFTIMRQMRNYMSHNDNKNFVVPSDKQIAMIAATIKKYETKNDSAKKHMKKVDLLSVKTGDTIKTALKLCGTKKINVVPVYSIMRGTPIYGCVNLLDMITFAEAKGYNTKMGDIKKNTSFGFAKTTDDYNNLPSVTFVTEDGTNKTKALGIIIKD